MALYWDNNTLPTTNPTSQLVFYWPYLLLLLLCFFLLLQVLLVLLLVMVLMMVLLELKKIDMTLKWTLQLYTIQLIGAEHDAGPLKFKILGRMPLYEFLSHLYHMI